MDYKISNTHSKCIQYYSLLHCKWKIMLARSAWRFESVPTSQHITVKVSCHILVFMTCVIWTCRGSAAAWWHFPSTVDQTRGLWRWGHYPRAPQPSPSVCTCQGERAGWALVGWFIVCSPLGKQCSAGWDGMENCGKQQIMVKCRHCRW